MKLKKFFIPSLKKRILFFLTSDIIIFAFSFYFAFLLRFNFFFPDWYIKTFLLWLPFVIFFKLTILWLLKIYKVNWRFIGLNEFIKVIGGLFLASSIFFVLNLFVRALNPPLSVPLSVVFIDFFVSTFLVSLIRISKRVYLEILDTRRGYKHKKRVAIVGAGNTGERIVRELKRNDEYLPVFFVDDDPKKVGTYIHGTPVLGKIEELPLLLKENRIETAIIAIPSLSHKRVREIYELLRKEGIKDIKIVPSISKLPSDVIQIKDLKDISIEDLLYREPVKIEKDKVKGFLQGKKILVTGAGGSIGSEIVRQLIAFKPKEIIALEIDETELHNLMLELQKKAEEGGVKLIPVVADVRDKDKIKHIFQTYKPDVVFHAAAYKHVPMMELFPEEAVKTNIFGTYNVATAAVESGVEKFVNISTDKAVNPTSVMGATKRVAEIICNALNDLGKTKFVSVRFGNVLASRGSVIPIFLEQIKKGGPVTVTHPEMKRYFMTIPEAVLLVFQAAAMGKGGEVFVLDMGEPVKILKLAEDLIRLQGLEPYKDIDIVFTGLRPGEKLFEELLTAEEGTEKTYHDRIYIAKISSKFSLDEVKKMLEELKKVAFNPENYKRVKEVLKKYVPFYKESS